MILSGKDVAEAIQKNLQVTNPPTLAMIRVGDNPSDMAYEKGATTKLTALGLKVDALHLPETVTQADLDSHIQSLNNCAEIHGILVFQPLPAHLSAMSISSEKDVDCSTLESLGKLVTGQKGFHPGAPAAVMALLQHYNIDIQGKNVTLIGRSTVVGKPLALLLTQAGATVTICHSKTQNLPQVAKNSDILITSAGKPNLITADFVHPEQYVIDISTNVVDGKLCGDIDPQIHDLVKGYTPTPGGIGAICTTILAKQVVEASQA